MDPDILEQILEGSMTPTKVPFETLSRITDGFSRDRIIGEGGFGTVYKGLVGNRNAAVAVKRFKSNATVYLKFFSREFESLMEANHENVVRFLGLCSHTVEEPVFIAELGRYTLVEKRERLFCFEYISNGSLDQKITDEFRGLEWDTRYQIIKGICAGLHYLHEKKRILHMDLKPANILLDDHMVPKITDFGLSRPAEKSQTTTKNFFSSPGYGAPENESGQGRKTKMSDLYSLGVIIIELVTGHRGIPDSSTNILRRWRHRWNKSPNNMLLKYREQVAKCIEIGLRCQDTSPYKRSSISKIMQEFDELDSNQSTVGQKTSPYWEDDILRVEPLELRFTNSGHNNDTHQILSCLVELSNDTNGYIAFKIQTTSLLSYSIQPNMDIVKSGFKCRVRITLYVDNTLDYERLLEYSTTKQYIDEFHVRSIKVNADLTIKDLKKEMFDLHTGGQNVDEVRLLVISFNNKMPFAESITTHVHINHDEPSIFVPNSDDSSVHSTTGRVHIIDEEQTIAPPNSGDSSLQSGIALIHLDEVEGIIGPPNSDNSSVQSSTMDLGVNEEKKSIAPPNSDGSILQPGAARVKFADEELITALPNTGARPTLIQPGSVQLVIMNNKKAPLLEYNKKVMLELIGGDCTSDRPGLDLVAVLDVGVHKKDAKVDTVKRAMDFVIGKLSPIDRLSIVTFSYAAKVLSPLRYITEASRLELQKLMRDVEDYGRASNMKDGLLTGLKVLADRDRNVRNGRVVAIMLMSDGQQARGDATQVPVGDVPVYTFGLGTRSDARVLSAIAAKSMGGTYSHVQDSGGSGLAMAFSQCLAGLLTVSVRDLELTVAPVGDKSALLKVAAGSYLQLQARSGGSVTVRFGDLYAREVRTIIVDIRLPTIHTEGSAEILKVTYSYSTSSSTQKLQFVAPPATLSVWRTGVQVTEEETVADQFHKEKVRLRTAKIIQEARSRLISTHAWCVTPSELGEAQKKLVEARRMLLEDDVLQPCDPLLQIELLQLLELCKNQDAYDMHVLPYALSSESSHARQRFAARGGDNDAMRLFATPRMDKYLEQAKLFHQDRSMVLKSADHDIKEVASSREETQNNGRWRRRKERRP